MCPYAVSVFIHTSDQRRKSRCGASDEKKRRFGTMRREYVQHFRGERWARSVVKSEYNFLFLKG